MTEFTLELNRRRVLAGILVIGLAAAAAGVGTFALFSDQETSQNSINAGTLNLTDVTGNLSVDNIVPTESTGTKTIETSYEADVGSDLYLNVSVNDSDFASQLNVETFNITQNGAPVFSDNSGTLSQLSTSYNNSDTGIDLSDQNDIDLNANFTMDRDAGNKYQGNTTDITITFNATQQT